MKNVVRRLSVLMVTGFLFLVGCAPGTSGSGGKFVVGMECAYAPYNWTTSVATETSVDLGGGQHCDGFDVMIAREIAEGLGKELVVEKVGWEGLIPALQSNQIDAIIAGMSPTDERKQEIAFSDIYYRGKFGVMVLANGPYANAKTVNDFAGARLTGQLGTFHLDLLDQLSGITKLDPMKDFPTMTVATKSGEINGFFTTSSTGESIVAENSDLTYIQLEEIVVDPGKTGVAVGMRKGETELQTEVNRILADLGYDQIDAYMKEAKARQISE